ncbi:MAG: response regulator transcription factor [Solirubrobacterales bacterium]|nr:response regulator transcription factor [Solirubrobacterales bacterium]
MNEAGSPIRVLIVDDHDLYRSGLAGFLDVEPDIEVVAQASGGRVGVRLAAELRPDVVLMDLKMPDLDGWQATREILDNHSGARVVALTVAPSDTAVTEALQAGACGFLAKDTPVDSVVAAVRAASTGAAWLSPLAASVVLTSMRRPAVPKRQPSNPAQILTPRELDVLRLLARGLENDEIAGQLHISRMTAKNHVSSILAKLGLPSRVQAAVYAVRSGLDLD